MAPNNYLSAQRVVATRLLKAGFTNNFARVRAGDDGVLEIELQCKMSKAFNTFSPVKLIPDHRYLFISREQLVASGIPPQKFVLPTSVRADVEGDAILPFVRLPGPPGLRPWMYYTEVEGSFVRIVVRGKQEVTRGLEEHRYTNWNGVFFLRRTTGIRPTDYGVVPIDKKLWNEICAELSLSQAQTKLMFNKAAKAVSHGHMPDAEFLYNGLMDLKARGDEGAPVTRALVDGIIEFAKTQQFALSDGSRLHRQERLEEQVHSALDELQELVKGCGMATPLQSSAIEQWIYARMTHPHVLRVFTNPPAFYSWEGAAAENASEVRGKARIEVEMEGHDTFQHGVVFDLELPAMTGEGCDFLHNNLEDLAANMFDYEEGQAPVRTVHYAERTTKAEPEFSARTYFKGLASKPLPVVHRQAPAMAPVPSAPLVVAAQTTQEPRRKVLSLGNRQVAALLR